MGHVAERREQRFEAALRIRLDGGVAVTRNVSASGIYFITDVPLRLGERVRFIVEFERFVSGSLEADCVGHVLRIEDHGGRTGVAAAINSFQFHRVRGPSRQAQES